jgi:23S rRNA (guanosine2251-2'-O)-methyltransferase
MAAETLYGIHPVLEALQGGQRYIWKVLVSTHRQGAEIQRILALAAREGIPIETVERAHLNRMLGHDIHQGIAALVQPLGYQSFAQVEQRLATTPGPQTVLVLDGVTDTGNFAALIRSAVAFGVETILLPRHNSVPLTSAVAKRSAGAIEQVTLVQAVNLVRALKTLKQNGFWIYGADAHAAMSVAHVQWPERLALVLGAEGRGIRRLVREGCDVLVRIPMRPGVNSLNVAVAGAIILAYNWERRAVISPSTPGV